MSKVAVVYWSGTGNTKDMANAVVKGASDAGAQVEVYEADSFNSGMMDSFDAIAFGCPSMGDEELESSDFEPMFEDCKAKLKDKKIALFGSYGWGDGEWMENWQKDCEDNGAVLVRDGVICNYEPDDDVVSELESLGKELA